MQVGDIAIERYGVLTYVGVVTSLNEGGQGGAWGTATLYRSEDGSFYGVSSDHWFRSTATFVTPPTHNTDDEFVGMEAETKTEEIPF